MSDQATVGRSCGLGSTFNGLKGPMNVWVVGMVMGREKTLPPSCSTSTARCSVGSLARATGTPAGLKLVAIPVLTSVTTRICAPLASR